MNNVKKILSHHLFLPMFALTLLVLFNAIFVKDFFVIQYQNGRLFGRVIDILSRSSILVILSLGMTFVIATRGIDISQGSVIAISGAVVTTLIGGAVTGEANMNIFLASLIAIAACSICGVINGYLISKLNIQPRIATLIFLTAGRGIAMLITKGQNATVYNKTFYSIGNTITGFIIPTPIIIAAIMVVIVTLVVKKTAIGLFIQSVGINQNASKYSGIKVAKIIFMVYVFSSICAGIAGIIESSMISASDPNNAGMNMEMDAILAVALGGTLLSGGKFYLGGSVIGALTIQTLTTTLYAMGVSSEQLPVFKAMVVIIICVLQSDQVQKYLRERKKSTVDSDKIGELA